MKPRSLVAVGTDRRLFLQLFKHALANPTRWGHRINRENALRWWQMRRVRATCNLCGHHGTLLYEWPDLETLNRHRIGVLRETTRCRSCLSKMRDRTLAAALLDLLRDRLGGKVTTIAQLASSWPDDLRVLDTDANGRIAGWLRGRQGFTASLFDPALGSGEVLREGVLNVDLEDMHFPDGAFDVILTSEVMEHVRFVEKAHHEIARCLDESGTYLFTAPYDPSLEETWQLVDPATDEDLVEPPHIHGDDPTLREGGIRSYRVFGRDLVEDLRRSGFEARFDSVQRPEVGIYGGDVFTARRISD